MKPELTICPPPAAAGREPRWLAGKNSFPQIFFLFTGLFELHPEIFWWTGYLFLVVLASHPSVRGRHKGTPLTKN
jgi:hypothetical protein